MKKMIVEIGYGQYVVDPRDAILLLDIATRAIQVSQPNWGQPYRQTGNEAHFVTKAELVDYDPLALPGPDPQRPDTAAATMEQECIITFQEPAPR